jgi:hypothetical protein
MERAFLLNALDNDPDIGVSVITVVSTLSNVQINETISELLNIGKAHFETQLLMWLQHLLIIPFPLC